ncbi:MAG: phage tail family protein [Parolsenella sp.]|uniref:phage distal tail protein n=1 Tax=Parolsenella sp. TaxID=2083006 RepID=UPI002E7998E5|nr:phage tail protein [Parolsenella sp.]MEE1372173.1 phage tail family protein [Parolsenella sp.]
MSASIVYNGHDFGAFSVATHAEGAQRVEAVTLEVPGHVGAALQRGRVLPKALRVRLRLDAGGKRTAAEMAALRHEAYGWLLAPEGGELVVPGDPGMTYRDAVCTDASEWSSLFEDGSCELAFTCFDPFGYGKSASTSGTAAIVGGTKPTWPTAEPTASAGSSVKVTDAGSGLYVLVEREFAAGDAVVMDFAAETVSVNGEDASADVSVASDFFSLEPGPVSLTFSGCLAHVVSWVERRAL